jgi:hypothetical protein
LHGLSRRSDGALHFGQNMVLMRMSDGQSRARDRGLVNSASIESNIEASQPVLVHNNDTRICTQNELASDSARSSALGLLIIPIGLGEVSS